MTKTINSERTAMELAFAAAAPKPDQADSDIHAELAREFARLAAAAKEAEAAKAAEAEAAKAAEAAKTPNLLDSISRSASIAVSNFSRRENATLGDWSQYVHLAILHGESGKQAQKSLAEQLQREEPVKRIETLLQIMNQLSSVAQAADEAARSRRAYQEVMYFSRKMEAMAGIRLMKLRGGDWIAVAIPPKIEQPDRKSVV